MHAIEELNGSATTAPQWGKYHMIRKKKRVCPECGSEDIARIVFGFPGQELMERAQRREIVLGGCWLSDQEPQWHCKDCEDEW